MIHVVAFTNHGAGQRHVSDYVVTHRCRKQNPTKVLVSKDLNKYTPRKLGQKAIDGPTLEGEGVIESRPTKIRSAKIKQNTPHEKLVNED